MKIRKATVHDISVLKDLYGQLFNEMETMQPYYIQAGHQDESFLKTIIDQKDSDILIADINGEVAGFVLIMMQETPPFACVVPHRYAYLADLITNPSHRGKGVASALMKELEVWSKDKGADYLELSVLSNNPNAIKLYEKVGYEQASHTYRKIL